MSRGAAASTAPSPAAFQPATLTPVRQAAGRRAGEHAACSCHPHPCPHHPQPHALLAAAQWAARRGGRPGSFGRRGTRARALRPSLLSSFSMMMSWRSCAEQTCRRVGGWWVRGWVGAWVERAAGAAQSREQLVAHARPTITPTHPPAHHCPPRPPPLERRPPPTMTRLAPQPPSWLAAQRSRTSSNAPRVRVFARAQMGGLWVGGGGWGGMDARRGGLWVGGGGWMDARREGLWVGGGGWMHARRGGLWVGGGGWMDALLGRRVGGQAGGRAGNIARSVADVSAPSQHVPPDHLCSSFLPCPPCCHASACSNPWAAARGDGGASG